jgi:hypothetical protein
VTGFTYTYIHYAGEVCRSYSAGHCDNGDDCQFAHDAESDSDGEGFLCYLADALNGALSVSPPCELELEEEYYNAGPPSIPHPSHGESPPMHRPDGKPKGIRPVSITIPPATNFLPTSGASNSALPTAVPSAVDDKKSGKGSRVSSASHRRTRSMSIPPTSGSPRSGTVNVSYLSYLLENRCLNIWIQLFPAESPGGL